MRLPKRIWTKILKTETCWLWQGAHNKDGYGVTYWPKPDGRKATAYVHRLVYEALVGPIPDGLQLDHVKNRGCNRKDCCNPAHLEPVTQTVNCQRWALKDYCVAGHDMNDPTNWYVRPGGVGGRQCQKCITNRYRRKKGYALL